jgi:hypothetical protein
MSNDHKPPNDEQKAQRDAAHARATIYKMIETNNKAIDELRVICNSTQDHKAYDTLGKLIDQNRSLAAELLKIQKDKQAVQNTAAALASLEVYKTVEPITSEKVVQMFRRKE